MNIQEAITQLDHANDEHWTADGSPRTDAVSAILGAKVTRQEITDAAPQFMRNSQVSALPSLEEMKGMTFREISADPAILAHALQLAKVAAADSFAALKQAEEQNARDQVMFRRISTLYEQAQDKLKVNPSLEFIKAQNQARAEKAERAQAFLKAGTSAGDIVAALQVSAPIDAAMAGRKPNKQHQRPNYSITKD